MFDVYMCDGLGKPCGSRWAEFPANASETSIRVTESILRFYSKISANILMCKLTKQFPDL